MPIKIAIVTVSLDMTIHIRHRASGTRRRVVFQSRVCFSRTLEILKKNAGIPDFQLEIQLSGGGRQNVTFRCVPLSQNSLPDPPVARGGRQRNIVNNVSVGQPPQATESQMSINAHRRVLLPLSPAVGFLAR